MSNVLNASLLAKKIYDSVIKNNLNKDTAVEMLLSLIEGSDSADVRIECIEVFGKIANKSLKVFKILENFLLSDESPLVRAAAAKATINNYSKISLNSLLWTIEHDNSSIILKTLYEAFKNSDNEDFSIHINKLNKKLKTIYGIVPKECKFLLDLDVQVNFFNPNFFKIYLSNSITGVINGNYMMCAIKNGHIKALNLNNWELSTIPDSIGNLIELNHLILRDNKLRNIPETIRLLENLETLELGNCQISSLPDSLSNLKNLKKLTIERNFQLKSIPKVLLQLAKDNTSQKYIDNSVKPNEAFVLALLEILYGRELEILNNNEDMINRDKSWHYKVNDNKNVVGIYLFNKFIKYLGIFPEQICSLKYLEELWLPNNALKSIPESIGELINLKSLNLRNNKIEIIPESIKKLKKLDNLKLADNRIKEIPTWVKPLLNKFDLHRGLDMYEKKFFGFPF